VLETWRKTLDLLEPGERVRFYLIAAIMTAVTFAETLSITTVVPLLMVLAQPDLVETNRYFAAAYQAGGFATVLQFQIAMAVAVCGAILGGLLVKVAGNYLILRYVSMREYSISTRLIEAYLGYPYSWFLDKNSAQTTRRILASVTEVILKVMVPLASLFGSVSLILFLVALLLVADPLVALLAGGVLTFAYLIVYMGVQRRLSRLGEQLLTSNRTRFEVAQEAFAGVKEMKVMGLEEVYAARFRDPARLSAKARATTQSLGTLPRYLIEGLAFATMVLMLFLMVERAGGNFNAAVPTISLFAVAALRMLPALQNSYYWLTQIRSGQAALNDLHREYVDARAAFTRLPAQGRGRIDLTASLELKELTFRYAPDRPPVVDGLSLTVKAGDTIGIVGGTGAGKTTLIDLLLGLLQQESGAILVDGKPIEAGDVRSWQRAIGYVPQTIFLADSTVAANIAYGQPADRIDMQAVEDAARLACLHDFVMSDLPEGYATRIGERGVRLSGGQRQRIGIARALYTNPSLLVLDEATSALDNLTEQAVMNAVHAIGRAKTIIMIAHRLSTVQACDCIHLLERGKVVASGRFDELVETSSKFRLMATRN
jgi:ABC-type multidrug transport system fused ATPase/permease subunit